MPRRRAITNYSLHRSTSGRLSSGVDTSDPDKGFKGQRTTNQQNVPRDVRDIVVVDDAHVFVAADYSSIEWAILMWMAGNEVGDGYHHAMLDRYRSGEFDPHRYLASFAFAIPEGDVTAEQRKTCKAYTHGRGYLGSPRTLARNAGHSDATGIRVCNAHEAAFRLGKYHTAELARVKRAHYVQTPLGWRCYFWGYNPKPTEAIATKIQATAADLCKTTLRVIFEALPEGWEMINTAHDSFLLHVPLAAKAAASSRLRGWMERPIDWLGGRSWRCEIKTGNDWREVS